MHSKSCKACGSTTRKLTSPGPRCATCHRAVKKARSASQHAKRVQDVYGLAEGDYERLYEHQEGKCFICQRATGASRRLSVDHDHKTGMVRGLLCRPCNDMLGHARDDASFFARAARYLLSPPAKVAGIHAVHKDKRLDSSTTD